MFSVVCLLLALYCCCFVRDTCAEADDVESRLAYMEKTMMERISKLESIVADQKQEIIELRFQGIRSQEETAALRKLILRKESAIQKTMERTLSVDTDREKIINQKVNLVPRERRLLIDSGQSIAFYAYMKKNEPVQNHKTLIFDETKTNYGHGYNNNSGIFTAPASGVYVLTTTLHPNSNSFASVDIVVNNQIEGSFCTDSNENTHDLNPATAIVVAWMNQGDISFIRTSLTSSVHGSLESSTRARCSFAGWKLSN